MAVDPAYPREQAERLLALGPRVAILKQGPRGVLGVCRDGDVVELPPVPVEVVCGLGAGDPGETLCHGF